MFYLFIHLLAGRTIVQLLAVSFTYIFNFNFTMPPLKEVVIDYAPSERDGCI